MKKERKVKLQTSAWPQRRKQFPYDAFITKRKSGPLQEVKWRQTAKLPNLIKLYGQQVDTYECSLQLPRGPNVRVHVKHHLDVGTWGHLMI